MIAGLRWILLAAMLAGLVVGYRAWAAHQQRVGEDRATERYNAAIAAQKVKAAHDLAREIGRALDLERMLAEQRNKLEKEDASNQRTVADLRARLRAAAVVSAADPAPRLRDPHAEPAGCGRGGGSAEGTATAAADGGAGDGSQTGGLLSAPLTRLLERITAEADAVNIAYIACRADAMAARAYSSTKE